MLCWVERGDAAHVDCLGCIFVLWAPLARWGFLGNKRAELLGKGGVGREWVEVGRVRCQGAFENSRPSVDWKKE